MSKHAVIPTTNPQAKRGSILAFRAAEYSRNSAWNWHRNPSAKPHIVAYYFESVKSSREFISKFSFSMQSKKYWQSGFHML